MLDFVWRVDKNSSNHNTMVKQVILCCTGDMYYGMTLEFICVLSELELINSDKIWAWKTNNMNQSSGQKKIDK